MRRRRSFTIAVYTLLAAYAAFVLMPVLITVASSIRPAQDVFTYMMPFSWRTFVPNNVTFLAYAQLFGLYGFLRPLLNSLFVSVVCVLAGILVNGMAGFAVARFDFPGKNVIFVLMLVTFMVPFEAIPIPLYELVSQLRLTNTYTGLILPAVANGLAVLLFRQFFLGLPTALVDSALVDGASWLTIFARIAMPVSKPVTVSAGILIFIVQWESFFYPLLAANTPDYRVLQVAAANFFTQYQTLWNLLFAAAVVAALVPTLLILPFQRYYVQALTASGIKE